MHFLLSTQPCSRAAVKVVLDVSHPQDLDSAVQPCSREGLFGCVSPSLDSAVQPCSREGPKKHQVEPVKEKLKKGQKN